MAEQDDRSPKKESTARFLGRLATHYLDRAAAAKHYLSGELEVKRHHLLGMGDVPWRVLRYERIIDPEKISYPLGKTRYVRPKTFELHLKFIQEKCTVFSLGELFSMIENKVEIPPNAVALTFDGGWFDNFVYAAPLLRRYNIPATMFLSPYFIGTQNYPWQDKVVIALVAMKKLGGRFRPFSFFDEADLKLINEVSNDGEISLDLISRLVAILTKHGPEERLMALTTFGTILDLAQIDLPTEPAFMSWNDVAMMNSLPVTIGALTHGGSVCHEIPEEFLTAEILDAFTTIEAQSKKSVRIFAFPDGVITSEAVRVLVANNITRAVSLENVPAPSFQSVPPLILSRVRVVEGNSYANEVLACLLWNEMGVIGR